MRKNFLIGVIIVVVILAAGSIAYIHGKNRSLASSQNNTNSIANNSSVLENNTTNSTNNSSSASNNSSTGTGNYSSTNSSNSANSNSSNVNNGAASSNNSSSSNMNAANSNSTNNAANNTGNAKGYEAYFGQWKITKSVGTVPIYAMSKDDIKSYIGKTITISNNQFADTNGSVQSPRYEVKTVSGSEFFDESKTKLSAIGVNGDSIRELTIYNPEGKAYNMIYLLDNNTIIYLWDGVFFQGEK